RAARGRGSLARGADARWSGGERSTAGTQRSRARRGQPAARGRTMIDGLLEILESITRHRLRTAATAFGVFWGIFMVTLLLAGGTGLRNGLNKVFESDAVNSVWIEGDRTSQVYEGL